MLLKKPKPTPEANLKTGFPYEINTLLHCCFLGNQNQAGQLHHTSYSCSLDYLEHVPWIYLVVPQNTDNSQSWSYPILDQKKKRKKKKNPSTSSKWKPEKVNSYHCPWGEQHQTGLRGQNFSQSSGLQSLQLQARTGPFLFQELSGCRQDQCRVGSSPHTGCTRCVLQPARVKLTMNFP